jgi:hypothetical protein
MRRLDFHPQRKLRNPGRHLRALARWPQEIAAQIPDAAVLDGERFWHWKIQVFSKLVDPPHAMPDTQRAALAALFAAAATVEASPRRPPGSRVAVMANTPRLFDSEVTLFLDDDYFRTFLPPAGKSRTPMMEGWVEAEPADPALIADILPPAPEGLAFHGGTVIREFDPEWRPEPLERINWVWAFPAH